MFHFKGEVRMYDVLIIGAGVIGCSIAARLAEYTGNIAVIDREEDVSDGASKANSGIVHAGYDAMPGSEKARLNVKGAAMYPALCARLNVPYGQPGALVVAFSQEEEQELHKLLRQAGENGVQGCRVLAGEEARQKEPNLSPLVTAALYVPSSGLVSPYELTCALADSARENGADFLLDTCVTSLSKQGGEWVAVTDRGEYRARAVVNCAGVGAGALHNMMSTRKVQIIPRRGQYYLLDRSETPAFNMTVFQVPTRLGKGVLVSPTTHGNLLLGPTAEDIGDGLDTMTTRPGLSEVLDKAKKTWPGVSLRTVITTFSGVRAHEKDGDFIIGAVEGAPEGAFEAIGIESPGLSAAPAIGEEMGDWVAWYLGLGKRGDYRAPTPLPKPFHRMNDRERAAAFERDPAYGRIVCRCEQVTEAEIRFAIRRPVGARSVDAVKRRTRAGMGRCQGGFCSARVMQILHEETGIPLTHITKMGGRSAVLLGELGDVQEGNQHA